MGALEISAPAAVTLRPCCPALVEVAILACASRAPRLEIEDEAGGRIHNLVAHPPEPDEALAVNGIVSYRAQIRLPAGGTLADGRNPSALILRAFSRVPSPEGSAASIVSTARINITRTL